MTSTVPLLSHPCSRVTSTRRSPPHWAGEPIRIKWPILFAAAAVSFGLVAGVFAWIIAHPNNYAPPPQSLNPPVVEAPVEPELPLHPVVSVAPVFHHSPTSEETSRDVPLLEVKYLPPPSLVSRQSKRDSEQLARKDDDPVAKDQRNAHVAEMPSNDSAGQTYGTKVMFLNNRETAADTARRERKLVFVIHISGNFEDSCFT